MSTHNRRTKFDQHILRVSQENQGLEQAIRQWRFTGSFRDHQTPQAVCELCGNTGLRYHFQIVNQRTGELLWIGSDCILNFDLTRLTNKEKQQHIQAEIDAARFARLLPPLQQLYQKVGKADRRRIRWAVGKFERRGGFSPKDLAWVFQAMILLHIEFPTQEYPLSLRTKQDRQEYAMLPITARKAITPCLTEEQHRKFTA